jgi:hypothetical protein
MKKTIALAAAAALLVPSLSMAATYHYVNIDGTVADIGAGSAAEALAALRTSPSTIHSGVMLDQGMIEQGEQVGNLYQYISVSGQLKSVFAASLDAARVLATDKAPTSGFLITD